MYLHSNNEIHVLAIIFCAAIPHLQNYRIKAITINMINENAYNYEESSLIYTGISKQIDYII